MNPLLITTAMQGNGRLGKKQTGLVYLPLIFQEYDKIIKKTDSVQNVTKEENKSMFNAKAYSAASATSPLASTTIPRRDTTEHDVQIEILFCGKHNITSDVEVIPIRKINEAYERLVKSDVKYRFSIDMASLKSE